jgi:hypothetical protein
LPLASAAEGSWGELGRAGAAAGKRHAAAAGALVGSTAVVFTDKYKHLVSAGRPFCLLQQAGNWSPTKIVLPGGWCS